MAQACTVCTHKERHAIDAEIAGDTPNTRIATKYGLKEPAVRRHKKEHLQSVIDTVQRNSIAHAIARMDELRPEVHLPLPLKAKKMQERLLNELEGVTDTPLRLKVLAEYRAWTQEEAKLSGAYLKEADNPNNLDPFIATLSKWVDDHKRAGITLPAEEIADEAERLAKANNVPPEKLIDAVSELVQ